MTLDEPAEVGEKLKPRQARLRRAAAATDRPLTALEQTTAELRQDVTRLGQRVDGLSGGSTESRCGWIGSRRGFDARAV